MTAANNTADDGLAVEMRDLEALEESLRRDLAEHDTAAPFSVRAYFASFFMAPSIARALPRQAVQESPMPAPSSLNEQDKKLSLSEPCTICYEEKEDLHFCSGTLTKHSLCTECLKNYVETSLIPGGRFESRIEDAAGNVSNMGLLPCPYFPSDGCDCTELDFDVVLEFSERLQKLHHLSLERLSHTTEDEEMASAESSSDPVQALLERMLQTLSLAAEMRCPSCNRPGVKDLGCMHITCLNGNCGVDWCYCCGQVRGATQGPKCQGCDSISPYIGANPGWEAFALPGESREQGALHEFHRRRAAFLIRGIKETSPADIWKRMRRRYPDVLKDIPTKGRRITWNEIDKAQLPVFGRREAVRTSASVPRNQAPGDISPAQIHAQQALLQALQPPHAAPLAQPEQLPQEGQVCTTNFSMRVAVVIAVISGAVFFILFFIFGTGVGITILVGAIFIFICAVVIRNQNCNRR